MPPSPVSCAKPPRAAPPLSARMAWEDRAPKLIAETFSSAMSYGLVQSGPPTRTRGGVVGIRTGAMECTRNW